MIGVFTAVMAVFALQLHMSAGFEKQMPIGHEYIQTFEKYRGDLFGANRLNFVVKAKSGTIWNQDALTRLYDVTQEVIYLPGVDRVGVQSLWTPNTYVNEITEEGFRADQIIESTITPEALTPEIISRIQKLAGQGGFVGTLVSHDQTSAMITAEISEIDREGKKLDYVAYNRILEEKIRKKFEDGKYEIQIIGFAKQIGEIADGAAGVLEFCGIALLLTGFAVYWYCRSVRFTVLPLVCSLTSLVWQFGTLRLLGFGLDPLAVLVPFLVFAIGVSHGIQQINFIVRGLAFGKTTEEAARESFTGLLIPGTLALVTAIVSFITLVLIPIPMVRELAITASIGVMYKIVTNLLMLPLAASCFTFTKEYAEGAMLKREGRSRWLHALARVAEPRNAVIVVLITTAIFGMSVWKSRGRVIGTLQPGAPELRPESRFNRDAVAISKGYDMGLDWLTVVFEAPPESDRNVALGGFVDDFTWKMANVPGVMSVDSYSNQLRLYNEGYNEGNPKMSVVPIDPMNSAGLSAEIARLRGYMNKDASMTAAHIYLTDHKAVTINGVIRAAKEFRSTHHLENVKVRLAAGNAGVQAAINDEVEKSELPMMLYVYAAILLLVFLVYRDLRAMLACCMPLAVGTFIGYWFMKELEIGLTVATLPVMVLAVGIGVDYAFYIYNRLQLHLGQGESIYQAMEKALAFEAMATIFTAITLAVGVVTWSFSPLKFQADMGKLLAFMFIVNMIMAMTALPALAVVLEKIFPRKGRVHVPEIMSHRAKDR
ncbi:RND family transporter [Candidatus Deferrimicrobium sp.]|uniref:efflux RND transporter permease subunit n=1 Tax=Candidatus Deferrimicrobium sp. TaxID=3060586 RepID=UPI00351CCF05